MNTAQRLKEEVAFFKDFSAETLQQLANGSREASFEPNQVVVRMGDEPTFFGVLLAGEIAVWFSEPDRPRVELGRFKAGDTFAEAALMTGTPFIADFVALSVCRVLMIPV